MNVGGAYGGGKAGGSFDLITFVQRPTVILRALCWVCTLYSIHSKCAENDAKTIHTLIECEPEIEPYWGRGKGWW